MSRRPMFAAQQGSTMAGKKTWEALDVQHLQVLCTLLSERNVSRAARRLNLSQPAVSIALKRLREIFGDPLLVRSRNGMTPTDIGQSLYLPVKNALSQLEGIVAHNSAFDPSQTTRTFNVATPDYLSPELLRDFMVNVRQKAPQAQLVLHSLGYRYDYDLGLESGELDLVVGNWSEPPGHLRMAPLLDDEIVCMMRADHPMAKASLTLDDYLALDHLAPTPYAVGQRGVLDAFLKNQRLERHVVARVPYFQLAPYLVAESDLAFTSSRLFGEHYARFLPLKLVSVPIQFPRMHYYLLWHDRTHHSSDCRWLREQFLLAARERFAIAGS
ncbi:LysR family transcriptional regulator [Crenobacter sp. SG2305]|uniref:LysR family transcriptional regulator n=1 Tax=Crenobacter oryzisoli TaxID=3056844 RepID=UPI0025AB2B72|nr:LysR family transcriptional regulator [Crenobacter sp. SG2305]MDN0085516.1 LysR family transcriptional regulator [Crenobacter sp. SG2305]